MQTFDIPMAGVIESESQKHYHDDQNLASGLPEAFNGAALVMAVLGVIIFFSVFRNGLEAAG